MGLVVRLARQVVFCKCSQTRGDGFDVVLARTLQDVFAMQRCVHACAAQLGGDVLFDVFRRAFFHHQHAAFALAKIDHLGRHQGVGDVQHQDRDVALAKGVGQAQLLQAAHQRVVEAALHDEADIWVGDACDEFIQTMAHDVVACRRNTFFQLALFMAEGHGGMCQAHVIKLGGFCHQVLGGHRRCAVGLGHKTATHMASAYAQLQDGGHVRGLG